MKISEVIWRSDTKAGRIFDWSVIFLIVVSSVILSVETAPEIPQEVRKILGMVDTAIIAIFAIEYCLRVLTAPKTLRYVFSFFGIVDLLAIVPFFLSAGTVDMRGLRIVRLLRIIRILKLSGYDKALVRFGKAVALAKEEIVLFMFVTAVLLYIAAFGIFHFEHSAQPDAFPTVLHSMWWATATLTTVGYGDVYPITAGGKIFTGVILMCGMGIVAVPAGLVAAALSQIRQDEIQARPKELEGGSAPELN